MSTEQRGHAVKISRSDGTFFLASGSQGVLPAVWPWSQRAQAVKYKRELAEHGFKCKVVEVLYSQPMLVYK